MRASEITYIVVYRCHRCGASLEARTDRAHSWVRCPKCGRGSLPPDNMPAPRAEWRAPTADDVLVIGPEPETRPARPPGLRWLPYLDPYPGSAKRIAIGTVLFVSLLMFLFAAIDQNGVNACIFAFIAVVLFLILVRPTRRR